MTHEANLSDKLIEDEWQMYCDELANDANGNEEEKDSHDKEDAPPQAWRERKNDVMESWLG